MLQGRRSSLYARRFNSVDADKSPRRRNGAGATLITLLLMVAPPAQIPLRAAAEAPHAHYVGVASCASSNCHGSVAPRKGSNVLQNEFVTWLKHDRHSKAWLALANPDGKKIAENLGIAEPEREPLCLKCHATYAAGRGEAAGEKFRQEDGVGCESCHGAAEHYLPTHTAIGATHDDNVRRGMRDLTNLEQRASLCLDCHFGNDDQFVSHRLYGAGHPRLSFELDTFGMLQPKHWIVDEDYRRRKGDYVSARAWIAGEIVLAERGLDLLLSATRRGTGRWPEFAAYNCFSCHHSLQQQQWRSRTYRRPGEPTLNAAALEVLAAAYGAIDRERAADLRSTILRLHQLDDASNSDELRTLRRQLKQWSTEASAWQADRATLLSVAAELRQLAERAGGVPYEVAEQIAMGLASILATIPASERGLAADVRALYATLREPANFAVEDFSRACNRVVSKLVQHYGDTT